MRCPVWCPQKQASSMQVLQRPQSVCECFLNSRCLRHEDCNPSDCFLVNVPTHLTPISRRLVSCVVQLRVWCILRAALMWPPLFAMQARTWTP